jgi:RimJ/RimL family protein N-acetyltransferase
MKEPKILKQAGIFDAGKQIGIMQIVSYFDIPPPHIEFRIDKEYQNKGIITENLKKYFNEIKSEFPQLMAVVEEDNVACARVLDKVGFTRLGKMEDIDTYMIDFRHGREVLEGFVKQWEGLGSK